jgi:hypothetical protein
MANTKTARSRLGYLLALASAALAAGTIAPAEASDGPGGHGTDCEREFEAAQRQDMESFRDYDVESFRAIHHEDAVTIFASGRVVEGADEIIAALRRHFEERQAVWSWTEPVARHRRPGHPAPVRRLANGGTGAGDAAVTCGSDGRTPPAAPAPRWARN